MRTVASHDHTFTTAEGRNRADRASGFTTAGGGSLFDDDLKRRMYPSQRLWWWGMFGPLWQRRLVCRIGLWPLVQVMAERGRRRPLKPLRDAHDQKAEVR
jgi:hypothetical protein